MTEEQATQLIDQTTRLTDAVALGNYLLFTLVIASVFLLAVNTISMVREVLK